MSGISNLIQCLGKTKAGIQCKKRVKLKYCHHHIHQGKEEPTNKTKKIKIDASDAVLSFNLKLQETNEKLQEKIINQKNTLNNFIENNRKKNEKIKNYKNEIKKLNKKHTEIQNINEKLKQEKNHSLSIIKAKQEDKKKLISKNQKLKEENKELQLIADKYYTIEKFEKMKSEIKKVFNWDKEFYIDVVRKQKKYHYVLENMFNMSIDDIISEYWRLRHLRNLYSHPY